MSTPITPMDLFREFSTMEDCALKQDAYAARRVYAIAVDLVDGMLKGTSRQQWSEIYSHIRGAALTNLARAKDEQEAATAWVEVVGVLDLAIESLT